MRYLLDGLVAYGGHDDLIAYLTPSLIDACSSDGPHDQDLDQHCRAWHCHVYATTLRVVCIISGLKYMYAATTNRPELYNVANVETMSNTQSGLSTSMQACIYPAHLHSLACDLALYLEHGHRT